ncbi:MAG: aldo/keto reductase [Leptolyngbyaceae cyanobacterium bins.59]|nr:aldo/keto reductase [Leptolyngbyaceae cyanobacterium bins.59]
MEKRSLGKTDIQITPLIMGTWQAGKNMWVGIEDNDTLAAIRAAVDTGITTIDTAEIYGEGHSERIVARAIEDVRGQVILATKVFSNHLKYQQVIEACENSLRNLKTDYIDLYQIHWPSGSFASEVVPIEETMSALNDLKQQGKIRAIGVSNFSLDQLESAARYGRIDSIQPPYSLFWRQIEKDLQPYCVENQISILAYSALAQGLLTGKFNMEHQFPPEDNRSRNKLFQEGNYQRAQQALDRLRPIADRHQTSLGNLALAWLIAQPQTNAIVGARNPQQAIDNTHAANVHLSEADLQEIDAIGRIVTDPLGDDPIMWHWR